MSFISFIMLGIKWFAVISLYLALIWVMIKSSEHSAGS